MVKIINSWAQGIVIAIIIATIIEIILPEGNNKKYVKVVLGMYIMFSIVYPFLNNISKKNINADSLFASINKSMESLKDNSVTIETNSYIEETYKTNLKEDITRKLNEKGYNVLDLKVYIETSDDERYGQINSMVLNIENKKEEEKESIKQVNINISQTEKTTQEEEIDEEYRNYLNNRAEKEGLEKLYEEAVKIDSKAMEKISPNDKKRIIRVLEIFHKTGKTKTEQEIESRKAEIKYNYIMFAIDMERSILYDRINKRVDMMIEEGLIEEVESIIKKYEKFPTAMQGLGYKEVVEYLEDKITKDSILMDDLGIDSLDATSLVLDIENKFNIQITNEEMMELNTVQDVINLLEEKGVKIEK